MDEERQAGSRIVVGDLLRRRKWWGILAFLGVFATAASIVVFLPNIFRSTATVLIERQQIPDDLVKSTVTSALEIRLNMITQEILSRSRLESLIAQYGLYADMRKSAPMERVIDRMREEIKIELKGEQKRNNDRATVAFTVGYSGRDPQKVAMVSNTLASFYIEENLKAREKQAAGTAEFLRVQLEEMKRKLDDQEARLSDFRQRYVGELPQQQDVNFKTLEQLSTQLRLNSDSQIQVGSRRSAVAQQLAEIEGAGGATGPEGVSSRLIQLRKELTYLRTRYSERYPDVVRVKAEVEALEKQLAGGEGAPKPGSRAPATPVVLELRRDLAELDGNLTRLKSEAETLRGQVATYQKRVENAPKREQEYQLLARDYETTQELYRSLLVRHRESELSESMEQRQKGEQFRIIEPAVASEEPAAPKRVRLLALTLLLSLGFAAGVMFLRERLDTSFHSANELRDALSIPVMVSIPHILVPEDRRRTRKRTAFLAVGSVAGVVLLVAASYFLAREDGLLAVFLLK